MNSILSYSQEMRDKGRPFTSKKLAVTYQYVLSNTLNEVDIKIIDIRDDVKRDKYTISFMYRNNKYSVLIDSNKQYSANKVQQYLMKII